MQGNKREDPLVNQLLQRDLAVSDLTTDETLTTVSATDTRKGGITREAKASAAPLCKGKEICRKCLAGLEITPLSPCCLLSHQPQSCRTVSQAGLGGKERAALL